MSENDRKLGWLVLTCVAGLCAMPGCLGTRELLVSLPPQCLDACRSVSCECRGKVYVFLVNGFDPLGWQRMADVRATLIQAGFPRVYDGQFYHAVWFGDEMRRIHVEE